MKTDDKWDIIQSVAASEAAHRYVLIMSLMLPGRT